MLTLEKNVDSFLTDYLIPPEKIWQPSDFLPNPQSNSFMNEVEEIRALSKELGDDFWISLVGEQSTDQNLLQIE